MIAEIKEMIQKEIAQEVKIAELKKVLLEKDKKISEVELEFEKFRDIREQKVNDNIDLKLRADVIKGAFNIYEVKQDMLYSNIKKGSREYNASEAVYKDEDLGKVCQVSISNSFRFVDKYMLSFGWKKPAVEVKPSYTVAQAKQQWKTLNKESKDD